MESIFDKSIKELVGFIKEKRISSYDVVCECIKNIKANSDLNALIAIDEENAIRQAKEIDSNLEKYKDKPLAGIPIVVKDNILTTGIKTTCASKMLENFVPQYDATVVKKLKEAGAIIVAKANMDEFAMGGSGENSAFGKTLNPIDKTRVTGGSSSGSAVSVASKMCFASLGTDTGGSIRQPASFCGVVGLKPTYGRVSRYGVVAFGSSLDQVGPITTRVEDNAYLLNVLAGKDMFDATSVDRVNDDFCASLNNPIKGIKIGVAKEIFNLSCDKEVKQTIESVIEFYKHNGAIIEEVSIPSIEKALAVYYILSSAEASSNLSRFDGIKYGEQSSDCADVNDIYYNSRTEFLGKEVKRRIMIGNYVLSSANYGEYYVKAQNVKNALLKEYEEAFKKCDCIISPVSPTVAFKFGEKATPLDMYLADIYTVAQNIVGVPAISFPAGTSSSKMPIGCQLIANKWEEDKLFRLAYFYEKNYKGANKWSMK